MSQIRPIVHPDLISSLVDYAKVHDLTESDVGKLFMRDPNLLRDLRNGREVRRATERKIREMLNEPPAREGAA